MTERWCLAFEGRFYYHVGETPNGVPLANGHTPMDKAALPGWWSAPFEAQDIAVPQRETARVACYRLRADIPETEAMPRDLAPEDFGSRYRWDEDDWNDPAAALYERVNERVAVEPGVLTGWTRIDGPPPPADGLTWQVALPWALRYVGAPAHLFPGELVGFHVALKERIEREGLACGGFLGGVHVDTYKVAVSVNAEYDAELPPWDAHRVSRGRRTKERKTVMRRVELHVADVVKGENRAAAKVEWDRLLEECVERVRLAKTVPVCGRCKGAGWTGATK